MNGDRQIAAEPLDRRRHVPRAVQYCIEALLAGIVSTVAYCVISKPFDLHEVNTLVQNAHRKGRPY